MKKEKAKRIAKRITAFAAAVAMAATFTFPAEVGDGFFDGFGNAIVASAYDGEYNIADGNVTINGGGTYRIYSTDPNTSVANTILIKKDVSATIILENVNIDVSSSSGTAAFDIELYRGETSSGWVTIELKGKNTLKSGSGCAGVQKNGTNGGLIIQGDGELVAQGGARAAGIGSGHNWSTLR